MKLGEGIIIKIKFILKASILVLLIIPILLALYFILFTDIGDRFARYHAYADIVVRVDKTQQNMKGIKINHIYETGDILETNFLDDFGKSISNKQANSAKFKEGIYGGNIFEFQIPKAYLKSFDNDINVRFGYDNHNGWHVNKYYIDVDVNQISKDKAKVTLYQKNIHRTDGNIIDAFENTETSEVTPIDNNISIYMGP